MTLIELHDIHKDYALGTTTVHALHNISLAIEPRSFISIVGPSGSGKTTLLNIIGTLDKPTSGKVFIEGQDIGRMNDNQLTDLRLFKIGFIFQSFNLIPVLTALENVEFPLLLMNKFSAIEVRKKAMGLLEQVQIASHAYHRPAELSGGQRQRVAIARALVTNPALVLADEPTANLDSETGKKILELMKHLNDVHGTTFIFSTHDPDVLEYASTIIKLKDGHFVNTGAHT